MNKRLVVRQNSRSECGPSCLLSIMKYYGLDVSLDEVSYILKTDKNGTNAYNIINGSRTFGFDGYGVHYSYEDIINNKVKLPIICHTLIDNMYHFIVVYEVKNKYLIVMNPSSNITKMSKEKFKSIYLNTSIVIYQVKKVDNVLNHKSLFKLIFDYIKNEKYITIKTIILSIVVIILSLLTNYFLLISLDYILPKYNYSLFLIITLCFLLTNVFKNVLLYIREKFLINLENKIYSNLNIDIIRKLFNLPYQFFKSKSIGDIESRLNDLKIFKNVICNIIVNICMDLIFIIFSSIILLSINYKLYFINIIEIISYFIIVCIFRSSYKTKIEDALLYEANYNKTLLENINGYESIKNLNMIESILYKIEVNFLSMIDKFKSFENNINLENLFKNILIDVFYIIFVFVGINYINKSIITIGEFILFNSVLIYFKEPIKNILNFDHDLIYLKNVYRRINDLIMISNKKELYDNYDIKGNISIKNLKYERVFSNINLEIKYGSKILIYGSSGIGKSTIIKIILKYINDYKGRILINNIDLKDISSNTIMNHFMYVSQNEFLFNDTIKNNILLNRDIDIKTYNEIINICNLDNFIDSRINRNDFMIEDNGFNISGGERQKIILARGLLNSFDYLILDEALSEVGIEEEKLIINKLLEKYKDKTIIYISHKEEIKDLFKVKYEVERRKRYE